MWEILVDKSTDLCIKWATQKLWSMNLGLCFCVLQWRNASALLAIFILLVLKQVAAFSLLLRGFWLIPDRQDEKICPFTVADGGASGCFNARENDTSLLRLLRWIYFSVHTPCLTCSSYVRISDLSSSTWRLGEKSINKHVAQFEGQSWPMLNWVLKYSFVTCKFSMQ